LEALILSTKGTVEIDTLPVIEADPLQMRQLLQNLIGNALKFHKRDTSPEILLSAHMHIDPQTEQEQCELLVKDNGIGFDEKYLDRIFTVFQRLHGRSEYEGTGVGLAVVRKIAERHGGLVTAQSTIGQGATFYVTLPVHQSKTEGK
jgi:light-regulated signal transduction histidine kinase (bacteriophytochrome)